MSLTENGGLDLATLLRTRSNGRTRTCTITVEIKSIMSNRRTHDIVGGVVGGAAAAAAAFDANQPLECILLEAFGGAIVGVAGSRLPDLIEPATSPRHRQTFHSAGTALGVSLGAIAAQAQWAPRLREYAAEYEWRSAAATDPFSSFGWWILAVLCRMGAGAVAGLGGGYVSHLGCDALTPMGIPLLVGGF